MSDQFIINQQQHQRNGLNHNQQPSSTSRFERQPLQLPISGGRQDLTQQIRTDLGMINQYVRRTQNSSQSHNSRRSLFNDTLRNQYWQYVPNNNANRFITSFRSNLSASLNGINHQLSSQENGPIRNMHQLTRNSMSVHNQDFIAVVEDDQEIQLQQMLNKKFKRLTHWDLVALTLSYFLYAVIFLIALMCSMRQIVITEQKYFWSIVFGLAAVDQIIYEFMGVIIQIWITDVIPKKIVICSPLLLALIIRPFLKRNNCCMMFRNYSYCLGYVLGLLLIYSFHIILVASQEQWLVHHDYPIIHMNSNPIMIGLSYYAIMFLLTVIFFKPLTGWLKNFKQNLHSVRLDSSLNSDLDNINADEEQTNNRQLHGQYLNSNQIRDQRQNQQELLKNRSQQFKNNMQKELERLKIRSAIMTAYDNRKPPNIPKFIIGNFAHEFLNEISNKLTFKKTNQGIQQTQLVLPPVLTIHKQDGRNHSTNNQLKTNNMDSSMHQLMNNKRQLVGDDPICSLDRLKSEWTSREVQNHRPWQTTINDHQNFSSDNQTEISNKKQNYLEELEKWQSLQEKQYFSNAKYRQTASDRDKDSARLPKSVKSLKDFKDYLMKQKKQNVQKDQQQIQQIKKEHNKILNKQEQNYPQCDICCQDKADAAFMPCGHGGLCFLCAFTLTKTNRNCHLCRDKVNKIYQLKLSKQNSQVKCQYTRVRAAIEFQDSVQNAIAGISGINNNQQVPVCVYYKVDLKKLDDLSGKDQQIQPYEKYSELTICDEFQSQKIVQVDQNIHLEFHNADSTAQNTQAVIESQKQTERGLINNQINLSFNQTQKIGEKIQGLIDNLEKSENKKGINTSRAKKDKDHAEKNVLHRNKGQKLNALFKDQQNNSPKFFRDHSPSSNYKINKNDLYKDFI
ncbi:zinc finger domain protein [Stylonychia lemnae]|uniref:Zinc finger domain protein n=1 Tax=Stylonychia lemnae TaxID=5949 RepID=A0A077ZZ97_STYLE|nr:zinc finger domain protein [Stylonychia lemnae]|eukprot:CDW73818.1 zinc finger domain protein [Stylonychia lemnae]